MECSNTWFVYWVQFVGGTHSNHFVFSANQIVRLDSEQWVEWREVHGLTKRGAASGDDNGWGYAYFLSGNWCEIAWTSLITWIQPIRMPLFQTSSPISLQLCLWFCLSHKYEPGFKNSWSLVVKVTPNLSGCPPKKICMCTVFKETPTNYILIERF